MYGWSPRRASFIRDPLQEKQRSMSVCRHAVRYLAITSTLAREGKSL